MTQKGFHCPDTERDCNPCLDAAKACNLNGSCKRQRASYINICSKADFKPGETCSRKRCHKALRTFIDRVPSEFTHRLLFCPCQTTGCAERRRQTIVPDCSYKDKEKPNCLELRKVCHQDPLCRWWKQTGLGWRVWVYIMARRRFFCMWLVLEVLRKSNCPLPDIFFFCHT